MEAVETCRLHKQYDTYLTVTFNSCPDRLDIRATSIAFSAAVLADTLTNCYHVRTCVTVQLCGPSIPPRPPTYSYIHIQETTPIYP